MSLGWLKQLNMTAVNDFVPVSSPERVFVYFLLLDSEHLHSSQPFFVGYANNLRKRLSNHAAVKWHQKRFSKGPKIWVAGSIHLNFAQKAVEDLQSQLLLQNVLLLNVRKKGDLKLADASVADLRRYTLDVKELTSVIQKWDTKWGLKHKIVASAPEVVETKSASHDFIAPRVDSSFLQKVVQVRKYKTPAAVALSQKLSKNFDDINQESKVVIPSVISEKKQQRIVSDFKRSLVDVAADWEVVAGDLLPGSVIIVKPTVGLMNHVLKMAQKTS